MWQNEYSRPSKLLNIALNNNNNKSGLNFEQILAIASLFKIARFRNLSLTAGFHILFLTDCFFKSEHFSQSFSTDAFFFSLPQNYWMPLSRLLPLLKKTFFSLIFNDGSTTIYFYLWTVKCYSVNYQMSPAIFIWWYFHFLYLS